MLIKGLDNHYFSENIDKNYCQVKPKRPFIKIFPVGPDVIGLYHFSRISPANDAVRSN
jgi:hypothetical protein